MLCTPLAWLFKDLNRYNVWLKDFIDLQERSNYATSVLVVNLNIQLSSCGK